MTPMYAGSGPAGGGVLLPGSVLQPAPQLGAAGLAAKPLKFALLPADVAFCFAHWAPQKVTAVLSPLSLSPMTNAPPPGAKAKTSSSLQGIEMELPAPSVTETITL